MIAHIAVAVASIACAANGLSVSTDTQLDRDVIVPTPKPTTKPETIAGIVIPDRDLEVDILNGNYPDGMPCISDLAWKYTARTIQDILREQGTGPCKECHSKP